MATPSLNAQAGSLYLPTQKTIGNKTVLPQVDTTKLVGKSTTTTNPALTNTGQPVVSDLRKELQTLDPNTGKVDKPGFGMDYTTTSTTGGGLLFQTTSKPTGATSTQQPGQVTTTAAGQQPAATATGANNQSTAQQPITVTQPVKPDAPQLNFTPGEYKPVTGGLLANAPKANIPEIDWKPAEFKGHGYSAATTKENYSYDPREESMTSYHLEKLLDPNSDLMRRAVANANAYSAGRGLQSSSIAAGAATGAMIDRATPIAAQDAGTYREADQLGWNNSFKAEQANADRANALTMVNAQGAVQNELQNNQFSFQTARDKASMQMQAEMQELQYKQSLGMLDAQGQQRMQELQEQQKFNAAMQDLQYRQQLGTLDYQGQIQLRNMEREGQLQQQRDHLLQQFQNSNMDKQYLQQLEMTKLQWQRDDAVFSKNIDANAQAQYRASSAEAYNRYLENVTAIYNNPNMTADQQKNAAEQLKKQWNENQEVLKAIFQFGFSAAPATPETGSGAGPMTGGGGDAFIPPKMETGPINPTEPTRPGGGSNPPIERPPQLIQSSGPAYRDASVVQPRLLER